MKSREAFVRGLLTKFGMQMVGIGALWHANERIAQ